MIDFEEFDIYLSGMIIENIVDTETIKQLNGTTYLIINYINSIGKYQTITRNIDDFVFKKKPKTKSRITTISRALSREHEAIHRANDLEEVIDKAIEKLYCWGEVLDPTFQKEMLDILKEVSK